MIKLKYIAAAVLILLLLCTAAFCADTSGLKRAGAEIWGTERPRGAGMLEEADRMKEEIAGMEARLRELEENIEYFRSEAERTHDNSYVSAHNRALTEYNDLWRLYQNKIEEHNFLVEAYNEKFVD